MDEAPHPRRFELPPAALFWLALASFVGWLLNSYAIRNWIVTLGRLFVKFGG